MSGRSPRRRCAPRRFDPDAPHTEYAERQRAQAALDFLVSESKRGFDLLARAHACGSVNSTASAAIDRAHSAFTAVRTVDELCAASELLCDIVVYVDECIKHGCTMAYE